MPGPWSPDHPLIGRLLSSKFQIASFICEGGMAQVFCGVQDEEPQHIAIKVMHPELAEDSEIVGRFLREARIAKRLRHPNIVRIISVGEDLELLYMVMELLFGDDLSARVKRKGSFSHARATQIMIDVFAALQYAHDAGVVHRDIKPENVMLARDPRSPAEEIVKVLDFGIAKILDATPGLELPEEAPTASRSVLTRVGMWVGTPAYMSPEQGSAEPVDHRADLYSAGVLLYELIAGRVPFEGQTPLHIIAKHVREPPPRPSAFTELHPGLEDLILRLLSKDRDRRPQSAHAVSQELAFLLGDIEAASSQRWFPMVGPGAISSAFPLMSAPTAQSAATAKALPIDADDELTVAESRPVDSTMRSSEGAARSALKALKQTVAMDSEAARASAARGSHPLLGRELGGRYRLVSLIREGNIAQVFSAVTDGGRAVAIKILHPSVSADRGLVARFIQEAALLSRLQHPNIVRTLQAEESSGMLYIVMELLFGDDLSARVKVPGAVTQERAVQIGIEICRALEYAHASGVVHRDIKPENIMLCRQPETPQYESVKVLDFGFAKLLDPKKNPLLSGAPHLGGDAGKLTEFGSLIGTPSYMSPEQARGESIDHRTDIYALGVLLYEIICGRPPFDFPSPMQVVSAHLNDRPPSPSFWVALPKSLETILLRSLEKNPADRYQSATDLQQALEASLREISTQRDSSANIRWTRRTGRGAAFASTQSGVAGPPQGQQSLPASAPLIAGLSRPSGPSTVAIKSTAERRLPSSEGDELRTLRRPNKQGLGSTMKIPVAEAKPIAAFAAEDTVVGRRPKEVKVEQLVRLITFLVVLLVLAFIGVIVLVVVLVAKR